MIGIMILLFLQCLFIQTWTRDICKLIFPPTESIILQLVCKFATTYSKFFSLLQLLFNAYSINMKGESPVLPKAPSDFLYLIFNKLPVKQVCLFFSRFFLFGDDLLMSCKNYKYAADKCEYCKADICAVIRTCA